MKALLNFHENPRLSDCIYVGKGDMVYANQGAEEWGFTVGKLYEIQDVSLMGYLVMKNDNGETEEYTAEYFQLYEPFVHG